MQENMKDTAPKAEQIVSKVTVDEYAKANRLSRMTVYRMLRAGQIEGATRYNRQWRIPVTSL